MTAQAQPAARYTLKQGLFSQLLEVVIRPEERGVFLIDGQAQRWLMPGRHVLKGGKQRELHVQIFDLTRGYTPYSPELFALVPAGEAEELLVEHDQLAVLTADGQPITSLEPGRYLLWQQRAQLRAWCYDMKELVVDLPESFIRHIPSAHLYRVDVHEHQRAIIYRDNTVAGWLEPGRHDIWKRDHAVRVTLFDVDATHTPDSPDLRRVLPEGSATPLEVQVDQIAILFKDGRPEACVGPGAYLLWQLRAHVTATCYDTDQVLTTIPESCWPLVPNAKLRVETIQPYERGLLYVDGKFEELLMSGRFGLHTVSRDVRVVRLDMREQELQIGGQEVMTLDKVTIRVNLIVRYSVKDALRCHESQTDLSGSLYSAVQMAARRQIAGAKLERLLEDRLAIRDQMTEELTTLAQAWGVAISQVDLKDVILPGEMKTLLNRVIEAEKQAEANVILRREETAATRAQANAARVMADNAVMMRLKELEVLRDVASHVGTLNVVVGDNELGKHLKLGA